MRNKYIAPFVLMSFCAHGETLKMTNEPQKSRISFKHLNRIVVKNDRIASVSGLSEAFHFEKNEKTGEGYIRPSAENGHEPLSIGITTISGRTQDLILEVDDNDPNVLVLENSEVQEMQKILDENADNTNSDYESTIIEAMKKLIAGRNLQKLELDNVPPRTTPHFNVEFVAAYRVSGFIGYKFKISTEVAASFFLREQWFAKNGDVALAFSDLKIGVNKPIFLYVLRVRAACML
jgi:hypothetical protein